VCLFVTKRQCGLRRYLYLQKITYIFIVLLQEAIDSSDETIEPHPLWEYPCTALTDTIHILELSFTLEDKSSHSNLAEVEVTATDEINGVVFWCEWFLDDDIVISTGPRSPTNMGEVIHWDLHSKQGCHFLRNINNINSLSRLQFLAKENDCEISIEINGI
jgi:protein arginine N-methyltransferase 7